MMHGYGFGGYGGLGLLGPLGGLAMGIGLLVVVALVVWLVYSLTRHTNTGPTLTGTPGGYTAPSVPAQRDPALEIARERYARGEIDEEEYGRLVSNLK